jgi:membrane fusion protein
MDRKKQEQNLFREEVFRARSNQWLGELSLLHPLPIGKVLVAALLAITALLIFMGLITYRQHVRVSGEISPQQGVMTLHASNDGIIRGLAVHEGQSVRRGQAIARLSVEHEISSGDLHSIEARILDFRKGSIDESLSNLKIKRKETLSALQQRKRLLESELAVLSKQAQNATERVRIATDSLERIRLLRENRLVSVIDESRAEAELLAMKSALNDIQRQTIAVARQIGEIEADARLTESDSEDQKASLQRQLLEVDADMARNLGRSEQIFASPVAGTIAGLLVNENQPVSAKSALVSIIPAGATMQAELMVPSAAVGLISPGQNVYLSCDAYPYQQFGKVRGKIRKVSLSSLPREQETGSFRVLVELERQYLERDDAKYPLRPGMSVQAEISVGKTGFLADLFGGFEEFLKTL